MEETTLSAAGIVRAAPSPLHLFKESVMSTATSTPAPEATPTRDKKGRFAKGNPGGPGNPYARQVGAIRKQMIEFMTPERVEQYMQALLDYTLKGNMQAAKLLAEHTAGKPLPGADPDRMAMDEWQKRMETTVMMQQLPQLIQTPHPGLPLGMVRETQPLVTEAMSAKLGAVLSDPDQHVEEMPDLEFADDDEDLLPPADAAGPPSPNGGNGRAAARTVARPGATAPSPNGGNGRPPAPTDPASIAVVNLVGAAAPSPNGDDGDWQALLAERMARKPSSNGKRRPKG